jgi:hypothetical protein
MLLTLQTRITRTLQGCDDALNQGRISHGSSKAFCGKRTFDARRRRNATAECIGDGNVLCCRVEQKDQAQVSPQADVATQSRGQAQRGAAHEIGLSKGSTNHPRAHSECMAPTQQNNQLGGPVFLNKHECWDKSI